MVVKSPATLVDEHPPSVNQSPGRKLCGSGTHSPGFRHEYLFGVVAAQIGRPQLQADLVRAAGENENVASNISDEGLSTDPILTAYELDRQQHPRHDRNLAPESEPSLLFGLARRTTNAAPIMLNGCPVATDRARRRNGALPPWTPRKVLAPRQTGTAQATGAWLCQSSPSRTIHSISSLTIGTSSGYRRAQIQRSQRVIRPRW